MKVSTFSSQDITDYPQSEQYSPRGLHLIVDPVDNDRTSTERQGAVFKEHHEASSIELFFDLFFVANLTVFTKEHEIKSAKELASYIGFFTILWCTWLQIAIYDVRFAVDSLFARICKACHIGIMMGFAVAIPRWDTTDTTGRTIRSYRVIDLILMSSRILLAIQYLVVVWFTRKYCKTWKPLLGLTILFLASASIFLGTLFAFPKGAIMVKSEIAFYVVCGVEVVAALGISTFWRALSFKHTHLVERVGLLTLIIIGEGIIGMALAIARVLDATIHIAEFAGLLISGVLIIYFLYMLYFDQIHKQRFGTIRMQIWALLHYPLHVAYLLTVEAIGQLIVWGTVNDQTASLTDIFNHELIPPPTSVALLVSTLNSSLNSWANQVTDTSLMPFNITASLIELSHAPEVNSTEAENALDDIASECLSFLFESLQLEAPKAQQKATIASNEELQVEILVGVFVTIFYYFFIAAGMTLVMLGLLRWICIRKKSGLDYISIGLKIILGTGLALLSTMAIQHNNNYTDPFGNYFSGPWLLPTVALVFGFVVLVDNLVAHLYSRIRRR